MYVIGRSVAAHYPPEMDKNRLAGGKRTAREATPAASWGLFVGIGLLLSLVGIGLLAEEIFFGVVPLAIGVLFFQVGTIAWGVTVGTQPAVEELKSLTLQTQSLVSDVRALTSEGQAERQQEELARLRPPSTGGPGWHLDPLDPSRERLWDGNRWHAGVRDRR